MSDVPDALWTEIDADNSAAPPNGWPEQMLPSSVNNSARADKGGVKRWYDRGNSTQTTTGILTAYVLTYASTQAALYAGFETSFVLSVDCGTAATLNIDGLGAKTLRRYDFTTKTFIPLVAGDFFANQVLRVRYNSGGSGTYDIISASISPGAFVTAGGNNAFTGANSFSGTSTMVGAAVNEAQATAIASATTTDIGAANGNYVHITGTITITGLGTIQAGTRRKVVFDGALILTNSGSLILPTGANITTAVGDAAEFESEGSGNWRCTDYQRASGAPLAYPVLATLEGSVAGPVTLTSTPQTVATLGTGAGGKWQVNFSSQIANNNTACFAVLIVTDGTTSHQVVADTMGGLGTGSVSGNFSLLFSNPTGNITVSGQDTQNTGGCQIQNMTYSAIKVST